VVEDDAMTRPALRLTAALAGLVAAGAAGAVPAIAAGTAGTVLDERSAAAHPYAPRPDSAVTPPAARTWDGTTAAMRGPDAGQAGLAASSIAAWTAGAGSAVGDVPRPAARPGARTVRVRGPPR
jgi:hypothetical protein